LGNPPPLFFRGQKLESLQCALLDFSLSLNSDMHKGRSGKLLQIYVAWGYFNGQVLLLAEPSSSFIRGKKKQKFYNSANWHFLLCDAKSEKPPNGDLGNYCNTGFSLKHIFVLGGPSQFFLRGQKTQRGEEKQEPRTAETEGTLGSKK